MARHLMLPAKTAGDSVYLASIEYIISCLTDNPYFPEPWASPTPALADWKAAVQVYRDAYLAALNHDTISINARNIARDNVHTMMQKIARYLELVADDDVTKLISTGFELRPLPGHAAPVGLLPAPNDFRVKHGVLSGTLDVHIARQAGARLYEVQLNTSNDPVDETAWLQAALSFTSQHITLEGLTPGQAVWVRVRGVNASGNGVWTQPIRIIVV